MYHKSVNKKEKKQPPIENFTNIVQGLLKCGQFLQREMNQVCQRFDLKQQQFTVLNEIIWNGPIGVFEFDQFGEGTRVLAEAIAASEGFSIAGGGDTLAAIDKYEVREGISYISTGGGAFLEFVEGKTLPAVAMLQQRGQVNQR